MLPADSLTTLAQEASAAFRSHFGRPPRWIVAAPGRVNLIGEHTDYNDGFVLPMAIDRHAVLAADLATTRLIGHAHVFSLAMDEEAEIALREPLPRLAKAWANYLQGVVAGGLAAGMLAAPFDAVLHSDIPQGGGLSSSAALEVATATLLEAMTGRRLEPLAKALLCQKAEHDYAGVPCGIMDQFASVMGRAGCLLLLDCRDRSVRWPPLSDPDVVALIVNSNVKHALADGGYATRRRQCALAARGLGVHSLRDVTVESLEHARGSLEDVLFRRARHVVTENARTLETADALAAGDWLRVGQLMYASHASLGDDYEVSCAELDVLVEAAKALGPTGGVIGARMTGGGFGGCMISLIRRAAIDQASSHFCMDYQQKTGRTATAFVTTPSAGAAILQGG